MSIFSSEPLFEHKEIHTAVVMRKKEYVERTIMAANKDLLHRKVEIAEQEGWWQIKKNKKSIRMGFDKKPDEVHEDKIWALMADMGFKELSPDRNFKVVYNGSFSKQIDVFCKDDDCALVIECTQCEEMREKRLNTKLSEFSDIKEKLYTAIRTHYDDRNLKVKIILATKNIVWSPKDLEKAAEENIFVLADAEFDYLYELTKSLKFAAKYQFLGKVFKDEKIKNIELIVPATKGRMGNTTFYNFLIQPSDLLKIAYVSHQTSMTMDDLDTYQRMLKPSRLTSIAEYIDEGGQFPTNIVINVKTKRELKFEAVEKLGSSSFGRLHLPQKFASAWIIDGQHRLYGYTFSKRFLEFKEDTNTLPVLAYENLPSSDEAQLFVDINCEQQKVPRNLLNELYATLHWDSPVFVDRITSLSSRLIMKLSSDGASPFFDRIISTDKQRTSNRSLTLTNFLDGLLENKFFGEEKVSGVIPGYLTATYSSDLKATLSKATEVLNICFSYIRDGARNNWDLGLDKGGLACTNVGIRSLLIVIKELFGFVEIKHAISISDMKPLDIGSFIREYVEPLAQYINDMTVEECDYMRARSSIKGVNENALHFMAFLNKKYPDFCPKAVEKYLDTVDYEGTQVANILVNELQIKMFKYVLSSLKNKFFENPTDWWFKGVPSKVRTYCSEKYEDEGGIKDKEQYLTLITYRSIAIDNWDIFEDSFSFTKTGDKKARTEWLVKLNMIRNITHHAEKWPAQKEQVEFVKKVHKFVFDKMS